MIILKDKKILAGLMYHRFHIKLVQVMCWIIDHFDDATLTESFRFQLHSNDLHGTKPVRAIDLRSWIYEDAKKIVRLINETWEYDFERPHKLISIYHKNRKGNGYHLHIQVHPNTRKR